MTVQAKWWELAAALAVGIGSGIFAGSLASGLAWHFGRRLLGG